MSKSNHITAIRQAEVVNGVPQPRTFDQLLGLSDILSRSSFVPKCYRGRPQDILVAIMMGGEVGLSPMQALQNIAVINGKPSIYGDALLAIVYQHPDFEGIEEHFDPKTWTATCTVWRKGVKRPISRSFSREDARIAGLWGKDGPWTSYPKRMLQMRARGFALRDAFPDILRGLITREEAQDYPAPQGEVAEVRVLDTAPETPQPETADAPEVPEPEPVAVEDEDVEPRSAAELRERIRNVRASDAPEDEDEGEGEEYTPSNAAEQARADDLRAWVRRMEDAAREGGASALFDVAREAANACREDPEAREYLHREFLRIAAAKGQAAA